MNLSQRLTMIEAKQKYLEDTNEGVQQEAISELDRADQIAERQKRENDRREDILTREESLEARRRIGGVTEAGQTPVEKKETPKEQGKRYIYYILIYIMYTRKFRSKFLAITTRD